MSEEQNQNEVPKVIRIDISSSHPAIGKTTVAAVIADALDNTFKSIPVEVHSAEGDFHYRYDGLLDDDVLVCKADQIVVVDNNAAFTTPQCEETGRFYHLRDVAERIASGDADVSEPGKFSSWALGIIKDAAGAQGVDESTADQIVDIVKNDPVFKKIAAERDAR